MTQASSVLASIAAVAFGVLPWAVSAPFSDHFKIFGRRTELNPRGWPLSIPATFLFEMTQIALGVAAYWVYMDGKDASSWATALFVSTYALVAAWTAIYAIEITHKVKSFAVSRLTIVGYCAVAYTLLAGFISDGAPPLAIGFWAVVCFGKTLDLYWLYLTIVDTPSFN